MSHLGIVFQFDSSGIWHKTLEAIDDEAKYSFGRGESISFAKAHHENKSLLHGFITSIMVPQCSHEFPFGRHLLLNSLP